jgi:hypothetical protein
MASLIRDSRISAEDVDRSKVVLGLLDARSNRRFVRDIALDGKHIGLAVCIGCHRMSEVVSGDFASGGLI